MKKIIQFCLSAIITITGLILLPGHTGVKQTNYFPAPVAQPNLSFYANLGISGLYNQGNETDMAVNDLIDYLQKLTGFVSDKQPAPEKVREQAQTFLNNIVLSGFFKPIEIYFYLRDYQNFAAIIYGEFNTEALARKLGNNRVNYQGDGFHSMLKIPGIDQFHLFVKIDKSSILICPDNISPAMISNLNAKSNLLADSNNTFGKMMRIKPAIACEAALEKIITNNWGSEPEWMHLLKHFRLLVSDKMVKMQLITKEEEQRLTLLQTVTDSFSPGKSWLAEVASFVCQSSESSVFVETESGPEIEKLFSRKLIAFAMQFFLNPESTSLQISNTNVYD